MIDWMRRHDGGERRAPRPPNDFDPPYTTIHVGMIAGGTANNITARDCTFSGEVRSLPDESVAGWRERILAEAARRSAAMRAVHPDAGIAFETRMDLPGFAADRPGRGASPARSPATTAATSSPTRPRPATSRPAASRR